MNVDSRKNARIPSAARGAPNMGPAKRANSAQLVPDWNSMVIPVATPTTNEMAKGLIQNLACTAQAGSPVRR